MLRCGNRTGEAALPRSMVSGSALGKERFSKLGPALIVPQQRFEVLRPAGVAGRLVPSGALSTREAPRAAIDLRPGIRHTNVI